MLLFQLGFLPFPYLAKHKTRFCFCRLDSRTDILLFRECFLRLQAPGKASVHSCAFQENPDNVLPLRAAQVNPGIFHKLRVHRFFAVRAEPEFSVVFHHKLNQPHLRLSVQPDRRHILQPDFFKTVCTSQSSTSSSDEDYERFCCNFCCYNKEDKDRKNKTQEFIIGFCEWFCCCVKKKI